MTSPYAKFGSDDAAEAAEELVRGLLEARIGPVARGIASNEPFTDLGISSIDLVCVVAAIERDSTVGESAEFTEVARSFATLAAYYLTLRESR